MKPTRKEPTFTFGIEEEYHLVDLATRDLAAAPQALMDACAAAFGKRFSAEALKSQVEIGTPICSTSAEARGEIARLRTGVGAIAKSHGLAPLAASTHPFGDWRRLQTTDKERYQALARDLAIVGRRLAVCGMHVHVAIEDDDLRIDLMNQMRYFLPHLLVLATSSPFWDGADTGLKSYRLAVTDETPRTGMPGRFAGWGEYQRTVGVLVDAGIIEDASKIWWDLRPSANYPTLEMRITDVCPRIEDAIAIAAIYRCLCRTLYRLRRDNQSWRQYPVFLLEENRWRAQRYGVTGTLFDLGKGVLVPFKSLMEEILVLIADDAAHFGCEAEVAHARTIVSHGTSADRQVAAYTAARTAGASNREALGAVVDAIVGETLAV
jgi:carboxylate-amine ligase